MGHKLYIITGATASAKTDVALYISSRIDTEIISADSMQVYRGMDIGTSKVPLNIRKVIPHYLIDILDPWESYNLGMYVKDVKAIVSTRSKKGRLLLVVGGAGLYIKGLTNGVFNGPSADPSIRNRLKIMAQEKGTVYLHNLLKKVDPVTAIRLHPDDQKRVIRAFEVYEKTGISISKLQEQWTNCEPGFDYSIFVINRSKDDLYKRIDNRVEKMFGQGLVDEVKSLMNNPRGLSKEAQQAVGYKETLRYLIDRELGLDQTKDLIKQNTRNLAKRQITWFKGLHHTNWIDVKPEDDVEIIGNKILKEIERLQ